MLTASNACRNWNMSQICFMLTYLRKLSSFTVINSYSFKWFSVASENFRNQYAYNNADHRDTLMFTDRKCCSASGRWLGHFRSLGVGVGGGEVFSLFTHGFHPSNIALASLLVLSLYICHDIKLQQTFRFLCALRQLDKGNESSRQHALLRRALPALQ